MDVSFAEIASNYWNNIEALETMVGLIGPSSVSDKLSRISPIMGTFGKLFGLTDADRGKLARMMDDLGQWGKTVELEFTEIEGNLLAPTGDPKSILESIASDPNLAAGFRAFYVMDRGVKIINRSAFVMLTSFFQVLLSDLIHSFFSLHPEALIAEERNIAFAQLREFKTIDDAVDYVVSSRAEELLRGDMEGWNERFIRKHLKSDLAELVPGEWGVWAELFQRRNVLVHNDGRVNRIYLNKVGQRSKGTDTDQPALGDQLEVSDEYLHEAMDLFLVVGLRLIDLTWGKLVKEQRKERDDMLTTAISLCFPKAKWTVIEQLGEFASKRPCSSEAVRLRFMVNRWLAIKRSGRWDSIKGEVQGFDTSACHPTYAMSISALRDDRESFLRELPAAIKAGFTIREAANWPVLDEFRGDRDLWEKVITLFDS